MIPVLTRPALRRPPQGVPFDPLALPGLVLYTYVPGAYTPPTLTSPNTHPGTLAGATLPTWDAATPGFGLAGSLAFGAPPNANYVRLSGMALPSLSGQGVGKAGQGPAGAIRLRLLLPAGAPPAGWRIVLARADAAAGLFLFDGKLDYGGFRDTTALPTGEWVDICLNSGADGVRRIWVNGALRGGAAVPSGLALDDLGGSSGVPASYGLGARVCDLEVFPRDLAAAEIIARRDGIPLTLRPTLALPMDDGSGTSARDTAQVMGVTPAVTSLSDLSGHNNHHTVPGGATAPVAVFADPPDPIQTLGQDALRFGAGPPGGAVARLVKTGETGPAESVLSGLFAGTMWDHTHGTAYYGHSWLWGASNNGTFGGAGADQWIALGCQQGGPSPSFGQPGVASRWEAALKGGGASIIRLFGPLSHALPVTLGFRYLGGVYFELWVDGRLAARTTTGIPGALNLSGDSEFSPAAFPGGWQHVACAIGRGEW